MAQEWKAAGHTHDTLVHCLGNLSDAMARQAMADPRLEDEYANWLVGKPVLSHVEEPFGMRIFWVTFEGGQVVLWARASTNEFMLTALHERFSYTAALGFAVNKNELMGVHVLEFGGCAAHALSYARQIIEHLKPKKKVQKTVPTYPRPLFALN